MKEKVWESEAKFEVPFAVEVNVGEPGTFHLADHIFVIFCARA